MRIGIMLRAVDEKGGIGVYTRNVVVELLQLNKHRENPHTFILLYRHKHSTGKFADIIRDRPDLVQEEVVSAPNKALWDQVAIPLACRRHALDVLFHPKFTAPLFASCPVVMTVHGADWFMPNQAQFYHALDVRYMRTFMPLYFRKCTNVISVSQLTTQNFEQVLHLPQGKLRTVYFAPARHFRRIEDAEELVDVRQRYGLPERFILTLSRRDGGDTRKNLVQIFRSYAIYHARSSEPIPLVVGGKGLAHFRQQYDLPFDGYGRDISFPGWLEQIDLPAIYSLADMYLYPSNLEAFPIPITEAMACGTPIVTSNVNGLQEIAGDAALQIDPQDTEAIATAIERVLQDEDLRHVLSACGLSRSRQFSWDKCAAETLSILEEAACSR